ncbi:sulfotransferase domain-containing protein [Roseovarius sp. CAU 1744]|uniref:sulfotransferase domain-containing protein n=1 Tax=Roseovarius sp. CAU 1744 TaxID=3140368 RepID=UPI00325B9632
MPLTRPCSLEEMCRRDVHFVTDESYRRGLSYRPDESDIFISPYSKCGTTWMQQIVHGLRTGGSMDFDEITEVVPWLELAHDMGWDVNADQVAHPRAFKSHLRWDEIPKGGRYIVVLRDPVDAMVSLFRFLDGWRFESGSVSIDEFAAYYLSRPDGDNYWSHAASWWRQRARPDVLLLSFEGMKRDLPGTVDNVAGFIGVSDDPALRDLVVKQAGFEFMKAHGRQFDDHLLRAARDRACGLPSDGTTTKVSTGGVGAGRPLVSDAVHAQFLRRWQDVMTAGFGLASYPDLLRELG